MRRLFRLLNVTLDWVLAQADSQVAFNVDPEARPIHARMTSSFVQRKAGRCDPARAHAASAPAQIDRSAQSLTRHPMAQTATTTGLPMSRPRPLTRRNHTGATTTRRRSGARPSKARCPWHWPSNCCRRFELSLTPRPVTWASRTPFARWHCRYRWGRAEFSFLPRRSSNTGRPGFCP